MLSLCSGSVCAERERKTLSCAAVLISHPIPHPERPPVKCSRSLAGAEGAPHTSAAPPDRRQIIQVPFKIVAVQRPIPLHLPDQLVPSDAQQRLQSRESCQSVLPAQKDFL